MKEKFKNSILNLPEVIKLLIIYLIIIVIILSYIYFALEDDIEVFLIICLLLSSFYLLAFVIPVLSLYFNYLEKTKNIILILENESIRINDKIIPIIEVININIIGTHQHFNLGHGGVSTLPYNDSFYYLKVKTNKNEYYLTSLLSYKLDSILIEKYPNIKFVQNINSFPLIK